MANVCGARPTDGVDPAVLLKEEVVLMSVGGRVRGVVQRIVGGCEASPRQAVSGANALTELHRLWGVSYTYMYTLITP